MLRRLSCAVAATVCGLGAAAIAQPSLSPAYKASLTMTKGGLPLVFASWVVYEDREASITQHAKSPYTSALDLKGGPNGKEGSLETSLEMTARFWRLDGEVILRVELASNFPVHLNRYRSDTLLEELPTNGGCSFGGDYDGVKDGDGWRFDLNLHPDDDCKASVQIEPMEIVERN